MSGIFISYTKSDRQKVSVLAKGLEAEGYEVWWDIHIRPGEFWDQKILEHLTRARCVVVAWSKQAVQSDHVRGEAELARRRKVAVPVLIDEVSIDSLPPVFQLIQTADLTGWNGEPDHPEWAGLLRALARLHDTGDARPPEEPKPRPPEESKPRPPEEPKPQPPLADRLPLSPGAQTLVRKVEGERQAGQAHLGIRHWLAVLVERHSGIVERFTGDLDLPGLLRETSQRLWKGDPGLPFSVDDALAAADGCARGRGKSQIWERDLAEAVVTAAGLRRG